MEVNTVWLDPVKEIKSANDRVIVNSSSWIRCMHRQSFKVDWSKPLDLTAQVTVEEFSIKLHEYIFDFAETEGVLMLYQMGKCTCGKLFVFEYCRKYTIQRRDAYGVGKHMYTSTEERV